MKEPGNFAKYSVGTGMENNALILRALGWNSFRSATKILYTGFLVGKIHLIIIKTWVSLETFINYNGCTDHFRD